jgi:L-idonate 5-dehydrogenase
MTMTKAATIFAAEDLRVVERPLGALAAGMVRVAFGAGGVCGSDMHYFAHGRVGDFKVKEPLVLGHEISGRIAEIGADAARVAPSLKVGQRIAVNPSRWCGTCVNCKQGRLNLCDNIFFMGSASKWPHMQGGFSQQFDCIPAQCVPVPDHVTFTAAALAEPLAVCLHAVGRPGNIAGLRALVLGAGPIGLLTMMATKRAGVAEIAVGDIAAAPLAYASRLGATSVLNLSAGPDVLADHARASPVDIVFECSGSPAGLASAVATVKRGGTIVQIGSSPPGAIPFPANAVMAKEITLLGSFRFGGEFDTAVALIADGTIDVAALVSATCGLDDAAGAVRLALDRSKSMKVVLVA